MDSERPHTAPWWVKALVFWHVFCISVWACPKPSDQLLEGKIQPAPLAVGDRIRLFDDRYFKSMALVHDYLFTTGTWQYWDMFAPNPASVDWYGDAIITYKNGTQKTSSYPRMYLLSIPKKYVQERFRKFYERAHDEILYPYVFLPFCYRQALLNDEQPGNPPVAVSLRRHWLNIADPGQKQATNYSSFVYFTGVIDPKILGRLRSGRPY